MVFLYEDARIICILQHFLFSIFPACLICIDGGIFHNFIEAKNLKVMLHSFTTNIYLLHMQIKNVAIRKRIPYGILFPKSFYVHNTGTKSRSLVYAL